MSMPVKPAYRLYKWLWAGLDWLYPPSCAGCSVKGERWCITCQENVALLSAPVCQKCGASSPRGDLCSNCVSRPLRINAIRCYASYSGVLKNAILRLKYSRDISLGESLANHLICLFRDLDWQVDMVMPVPLSRSRFAERGYNQASLLGRPLAMAVNLDYDTSIIRKIRETPSQVSLPLDKRLKNLDNAFLADESKVSGRSIMIVDDVVTSGATMEACAKALFFAGASDVYGIALARTRGD